MTDPTVQPAPAERERSAAQAAIQRARASALATSTPGHSVEALESRIQEAERALEAGVVREAERLALETVILAQLLKRTAGLSRSVPRPDGSRAVKDSSSALPAASPRGTPSPPMPPDIETRVRKAVERESERIHAELDRSVEETAARMTRKTLEEDAFKQSLERRITEVLRRETPNLSTEEVFSVLNDKINFLTEGIHRKMEALVRELVAEAEILKQPIGDTPAKGQGVEVIRETPSTDDLTVLMAPILAAESERIQTWAKDFVALSMRDTVVRKDLNSALDDLRSDLERKIAQRNAPTPIAVTAPPLDLQAYRAELTSLIREVIRDILPEAEARANHNIDLAKPPANSKIP